MREQALGSAARYVTVPRALLVLGLVAGAFAAALNLAGPSAGLPPPAVARVGERLVLRDEWLRAVAAVEADRRTPLTPADRRRILDRLVDEQLLVQHGLDLGLAERDQRVRGDLVSAVMFAASTGRVAAAPDDAALRAFFDANADRFAAPPRLRVRAWQVDAYGERHPFTPPVPDALLPPEKLSAYVGPTLTAAALRLAAGAESAPLIANGATVVLQLQERQDAPPPSFEASREPVLAEYRRRADEAAVRALLDDLRRTQRVQIDPALP